MIDSDQMAQLRDIARRIAAGVLKDSVRAEDVAQDVVVKLLEIGIEDLREPERFAARIAKRAAVDVLRDRNKEWLHVKDDVEWFEGIVESHGGPSTLASRDELFRQILEPLSAKQRNVFLAALDGVPNAEIATRFGYASAGAVAVTLTRIRQAIRAPFGEGELWELLGAQPAYAQVGGLMAANARGTVGLEVPEDASLEVRPKSLALAHALRAALGASADTA